MGLNMPPRDNLRLSDFDGTVLASRWSTKLTEFDDYDGRDGLQVYGFWDVRIDHIFHEDTDGLFIPDDGVLRGLVIKIGKGFEIRDGYPHEIRRPDDRSDHDPNAKPTYPHPKTLFGNMLHLIGGVTDAYDVGDEVEVNDGGGPVEYDMTPADAYMDSIGATDPRDSRIWEGIRWRFRGFELTYNIENETSGETEQIKSRAILPVAFLGSDSRGPGPSQDIEGLITGVVDRLPVTAREGLPTELAHLLDKARNHAAFMADALKVDGVMEHQEVKDLVTDPGGLWTLKEPF